MGALHPAVDAGAPMDAPLPVDARPPSDVPLPVDARPIPDVQVSPDLAAPAVGCTALQPLADGVLTPRHTVRALFAPDRSLLVLRVQGEAPPATGVQDDLVLVRLPSGEVSPIISSITSAEWLQPGSTLLATAVRDGRSDLVVVSSDGSGVRTLVQGVCDHVAAPDGSRVYAIHDCDSHNTGTMDVFDVASGASTHLAEGATFGTPTPTRSTAVSPDGRWVAFMTSIPSDGGASHDILVVGGADGRVENLTSQPSAHDPAFVSDDLVLFVTGNLFQMGDIRGYVPGTGDTSYLVATKRNPGLFGYQVSPDKTWVLAATETTGYVDELYAERLDGSSERLLASDLYDFRMNQLALRVFAFSASGRVIYNTGHDLGVATIGLDGGTPTVLSGGASFLEAPRLDRVALLEPVYFAAGTGRLRLVDLASGTDVFAYDSDGGIGTIGFSPNDRGMVFAERRLPGPNRLRYASADQSVVLGEWQTTYFRHDSLSDRYGTLLDIYPVDPTGCFTVFDTDLAPGPGTRLAILPQ
jgi:hypothetical protein